METAPCPQPEHGPLPVDPTDAAENTRFLLAQAVACGFAPSLVACAPAGEVAAHTLYQAWVAADLAGEMTYLAADAEARRDPRLLCQRARGVLSVAVSYHHPDPPQPDGGPRGTIARYARAEDYHLILKRRLGDLAARVTARYGGDVAYRICVDTAPVLERALAAQAGLGFIGKNTLLITPGVGSYTLLGELLVELDVAPHPTVPGGEPATKGGGPKCGSCRLCLDVCPTGALIDAYRIDARRCISYLTIEHRGPIPRALRRPIGDWIFGCDLCQEVCPWNASATAAANGDAELRPRPDQSRPVLVHLLSLGMAQVRRFVRRTALRRIDRAQLLRNVAVALGNVGTAAELPPLSAALSREPALVRQHAAWAIAEIAGRDATVREDALATLSAAQKQEPDAAVRDELDAALAALAAAPGGAG